MKTRCPDCGAKMVLIGSDFKPSTKPRRIDAPDGEVTLFTECQNPDCPGKESDLAGPSTDEVERIGRLNAGDTGPADGR